MTESEGDARELKAEEQREMPVPALNYRPPVPQSYRPGIALIGCGGITKHHLEAYQAADYPVVAFCDTCRENAVAMRDAYYPDADVFDDADQIFAQPEVEVVDLATHPKPRLELIRKALLADKHVLSQKPFVTDIRKGLELVNLAEERGRKLAVNQNGRWAPYFSYLRQAVKQGLLGDVASCDMQIAWDHTWIRGTPFERIGHIVLYDFGIHWFDMVRCLFGDRSANSVFAQVERVPGQTLAPPMNAQAMVQFDGGLASLAFRAHTTCDPEECTIVTGTSGTFRSSGPVCANDQVTLATSKGKATVKLEGAWFNDGFLGSMGELLCAIEEDREPENSARSNLASLQLCFAAVASANSGAAVIPADVFEVQLGAAP